MSSARIKESREATSSPIPKVEADELVHRAAQMRALPLPEPARTARSLAATIAAWRDHAFPERRAAVSAIAAAWGYSEPLLDASFDALLAPFTAEALADFAASIGVVLKDNAKGSGIVSRDSARRIIGMVMPGNLPGAGLHEIMLGLLSGACLIVKSSSAEPIFFASFARSIGQFNRAVAERIAVFNWSREQAELIAAMRANCDWLAAFGGDETLRVIEGCSNDPAEEAPKSLNAVGHTSFMAGFGQRYSGAYIGVGDDGDATSSAVIERLARDVTLFEQAGCLSPHHIFVHDTAAETGRDTRAYQVAAGLGCALEALARTLPPPSRIAFESAAGLRRIREAARWRMLGGESVALWEGDRLGWTVIYDQHAEFTPSPGFRTITVSPVKDVSDLAERLAPVAGRLEAFAVAGASADAAMVAECVAKFGASYLCAAGMMQSPPLEWRHGGGSFLDALCQPSSLEHG